MVKEDYLRDIYELTDEGEASTTTSELAELRGVTNASASEAVQKLEEQDLVCRAPYQGFTLSPPGKEEAYRLMEKYTMLKDVFSSIGVSDPDGEADSTEHSISLEAVQKLHSKLI